MIDARKGLLAGIGVLFVTCAICAAGYSLVQAITGPSVKIEDAARKVSVEPTLEGIAEYINKSVKPGMSRSQVEQALGELAPYDVDWNVSQLNSDIVWDKPPITCDVIRLKLEVRLRLSACYNVEGQLVHFASGGSDDPVGIDISVPPKELP